MERTLGGYHSRGASHCWGSSACISRGRGSLVSGMEAAAWQQGGGNSVWTFTVSPEIFVLQISGVVLGLSEQPTPASPHMEAAARQGNGLVRRERGPESLCPIPLQCTAPTQGLLTCVPAAGHGELWRQRATLATPDPAPSSAAPALGHLPGSWGWDALWSLAGMSGWHRTEFSEYI